MTKFDAAPIRTPFNQLNPRVGAAQTAATTSSSSPDVTRISSPWEKWFNAVQTKLSTGQTVDMASHTISDGGTLISNVTTAAMRLVYWEAYVNSPVGNSSVQLQINFTQNGIIVNPWPPNFIVGPLHGINYLSGVIPIFPDVNTSVAWLTIWTSGGGGDSYDLHLRLDQP